MLIDVDELASISTYAAERGVTRSKLWGRINRRDVAPAIATGPRSAWLFRRDDLAAVLLPKRRATKQPEMFSQNDPKESGGMPLAR